MALMSLLPSQLHAWSPSPVGSVRHNLSYHIRRVLMSALPTVAGFRPRSE